MEDHMDSRDHAHGDGGGREPLKYRGWHIEYNPPPIPLRSCDWQFWHDDFDGAPDAGDNRYGHAATLQEAMAEIDHWHEEQAMDRCPTEAEKRSQVARCGCHGQDDYCPCQNVVQALAPPTAGTTEAAGEQG